ncbi:thioredoxin-like protein [Aspergillus lucknowensis]|uniref:Thioredoxin-like protein n=1 Tax=Aspergillus lucknowensis TaxID=176173 RepID=A0ABR4M6C3_9EURO
MAALANAVRKVFRRKNKVPLACSEILLDDLDHVHTSACFLDVQPLVVAELFQSQGCKFSVKNVPKIHEAVQHDTNIAFVTFDVTYFDRTEWQDTFASKQWDSRQRAYVTKWGRNSVFTPQIVFDGVTDGTGEYANDVRALVDQARHIRSEKGWNILLDANDTELRIDTDRSESVAHEILLIYYEPKTQTVRIGKGVNRWKKLKHINVVKTVSKVGVWEGGDLTLPLPLPALTEAREQGLSALAVVQEPSGGPIVAAHAL